MVAGIVGLLCVCVCVCVGDVQPRQGVASGRMLVVGANGLCAFRVGVCTQGIDWLVPHLNNCGCVLDALKCVSVCVPCNIWVDAFTARSMLSGSAQQVLSMPAHAPQFWRAARRIG